MSGQRPSPILTSSLEILEHAIEHLREGTTKDTRFAVLHADNAVELLLKEIARTKRIRLIDKKGRSIDYYECIDKLQEQGVPIPELPDIDLLHAERNSVYHLGAQPDKKKAEWLVYDVASNFVERICRDELRYGITHFSNAFSLSSKVKRDIELTRSEIVNKYLVDAVAALNSNMYEATVILAYSGIEALFRESVSREIRSHYDMLRTMKEKGMVSESLFKDLEALRKIRNQAAHGVSKSTREEAKFALGLFQRVIDEIGLPLELKCKTCGVQFKSGIAMSKKSFESSILRSNFHQCPKGHVHSYDKEDYSVKL